MPASHGLSHTSFFQGRAGQGRYCPQLRRSPSSVISGCVTWASYPTALCFGSHAVGGVINGSHFRSVHSRFFKKNDPLPSHGYVNINSILGIFFAIIVFTVFPPNVCICARLPKGARRGCGHRLKLESQAVGRNPTRELNSQA